MTPDDEAIVIATADLVGRTGATEFSVAYLHDDAPTAAEAGWYAYAQYKGARVTVEGAGPVEACDGLARRLLTGATCQHCHLKVSFGPGSPMRCGWRRDGSRWIRGCET